MSKASEKRKHPRVPAKNVAAHVNFADRSSPCLIQDISAGGMLVESDEPLPAGIPVAVNLARPGWTRVLRLPGRVVWALAPKAAAKKGRAPGMRIRFDPLDLDAAEMLLELLHELGIGETPPPDRSSAEDTLPPFSQLTPRPHSRTELPQVKPPSRVDVPRTSSKAEVPAGAPQTRTYRGASEVDAAEEKAPIGAPSTQTLPGHRTQELSLKDIVAHISKVDVPQVVLGKMKKPGDTTVLADPAAELGAGSDTLHQQVQALSLQLASLQRALEERERELAEVKDALHTKQLALEKADRERKAAETAIQRLSMQLASRR
jgi:hypothetical protein